MPTAWFILSLLALNLGALLTFALRANWPWVLIYAGASLIQAGSWWLTR